MPFYRVFLVAAVMVLPVLTPAYAKDKAAKTQPFFQVNTHKAHYFFTYLVKIGITDIDTKMKCHSHNGEIIPDTTAYMQDVGVTNPRVSYSCNYGQEKYITEMKIDLRYVSKIGLKGYNHYGEHIEISSNITTYETTEGVISANGKTDKTNPTRKTKLTFGSASTDNRALNAFTLFKDRCEISANYLF